MIALRKPLLVSGLARVEKNIRPDVMQQTPHPNLTACDAKTLTGRRSIETRRRCNGARGPRLIRPFASFECRL